MKRRSAIPSTQKPAITAVSASNEALWRRAVQCYEQGRHNEALAICEGLKSHPALQGLAYLVMGSIYSLRHQAAAGESFLRIATQKLPDSADAWKNLAFALTETNKLEEAEEAYRKALQIDPKLHQAWTFLGNLLLDNYGDSRERCQEALECYWQAIKLRPDYSEALFACRKLADWSEASVPQAAKLITRIKDGKSDATLPVFLLTCPGLPPDLLRDGSALTARSLWGQELSLPPLVSQVADTRGRRIRVGYLSADFRNHPITHLLTDVIAHHDKAGFEIFLYAYGPEVEDEERQKLRQAAEHFLSVATLSSFAAAEKIRADGIDLLVDLTGHTAHTRLGITALRPAAVIASWLGYTGSLGEPRLADYIIGDAIATPPEHAAHFSESLALMPHCYMPNPALMAAMPVPDRQTENLPENTFVFCSFNQCFKLHPDLWDDWCRILAATDNSLLWLPPMPLVARDNLRRETARRGIDPERLVFAERRTLLSEHQARLALADLALDTWPYNSCATASDALRAGVPLVTLIGDTFIGRVGASLLHNLGLDELIAKDRAAYIDLAVALANDKSRRQALRTTLASSLHTSPLFDPLRFARDLERLFQVMLEQRARGESGLVKA